MRTWRARFRPPFEALPQVLALVGLSVVTAAVYSPVIRYGVIQYDDPEYVVNNRAIQGGLRAATVRWALTSLEHQNWHPLTWMSHALDWEVFGTRWGGHHAVSVALHLATVVALFLALRALTASAWRSLAVAALFAVHPINVQSVVWLSERKNVLSGLLFAIVLNAYAWYTRRPTWPRHLAVTLALALGLMAKPMLVTTPFVLLLLDFWPLRRARSASWLVLLEKLPWLAMAAAVSLITVRAQTPALETLADSSISARLCSALGGYLGYLDKIVRPFDYAVLYPKPVSPCGMLPIGAAAATLAVVTALALMTARRLPFLAMGWLWFAGALVPVIGLVQVGHQLMADRYAYIPMLGLLVAVVWGCAELAARTALTRQAFGLGTVILVGLLAGRTSVEVRYWRDTLTLFSRALDLTTDNCIAYDIAAVELRRAGRIQTAWDYLQHAVALCPNLDTAHGHLASMLLDAGQLESAIPHLAAAAELDPSSADAQYNLALALYYRGRYDDAAPWLDRALRADPHHAPARELRARIGPRAQVSPE